MPSMSDAITAFWSLPLSELFERLQTTAQGLTSEEAQARLQRFGPNLLRPREKATALDVFLGQFKSPIILILLFATGVSAVTHEWVDALIILAIVFGSAVLSFTQEYRANTAAEKLRSQVTIKVTVFRENRVQTIPAEEITPGDVILLSAGSLIPADGVLLEAKDFFVNEAVLTGETFPVEKEPGQVAAEASLAQRTNCVFMGTNVRSGSARALIVQTGAATAYGQIAEHLTLRPPETDFERGVRRFGYLLSEVMLVLVLVVFAINVFFHKPILGSLLFSVALAVGLTPQLLPAIISITLSRGSQAMAAKGVIVRRLESIENFGSMDILCTDKTGTLTEGVVALNSAVDIRGRPSDVVLRYAYLNAHFQTGLANPMDEAIKAQPKVDVGAVLKVDEVPYDFVRKRLSIVVEEKEDRTLITKGALDNVLAVCSMVREAYGAIPIDDSYLSAIQRRYAEWSEQGFRVLGVGARRVESKPAYTKADETDLAFMGFLLFFDPPKPGIQKTIADLAVLGVELKMITGDNRFVAIHTAQAVGLKTTKILTGADLNTMRDEALWQAAEGVNLFVEVDPNQKERIILSLRKKGHVVGYMGDGVNDAPALHAADVGISVDKAVDVTKQAADFVLLEQDLAVLRRGIELGRTTFANTLKYIFITTSANFGNMFSMAGVSLLLPFLPLLPMQILLINFLTDFPAMTIATDGVDRELVERPQRWNVKFIRNFMITFGTVSSLFDYVTFCTLLFIFHATIDQFRTGWFLESVLTELLIILVIRTRKSFLRSRPSKYLLIAIAAVGGVTLMIPYSPLTRLLGFTSLPVSLLLALASITMLYVITSEVAKKMFYRKANSGSSSLLNA
jgi:Mg2+-importing ATPase